MKLITIKPNKYKYMQSSFHRWAVEHLIKRELIELSDNVFSDDPYSDKTDEKEHGQMQGAIAKLCSILAEKNILTANEIAHIVTRCEAPNSMDEYDSYFEEDDSICFPNGKKIPTTQN